MTESLGAAIAAAAVALLAYVRVELDVRRRRIEEGELRQHVADTQAKVGADRRAGD